MHPEVVNAVAGWRLLAGLRGIRRSEITEMDNITGPVIIEERETTIFVLGGWNIKLHSSGSLVATKIGAK